MDKKQIGLFVKDERSRQKLSQQALATKAELPRYQAVLEIEQGQVDYGIGVLIKVIEELGFKINLEGPKVSKIEQVYKVIDEDHIELSRVERVLSKKPLQFTMDFSKVKPAQEEQPIKKTKTTFKFKH